MVSEADGEEGDAQTLRRALEEVFGESSGSDDDTHLSFGPFLSRREGDRPRWEMVEGIQGLWLCRDFLSEKQQSLLLLAIQREGWFTGGSHNQAMRFGDLPEWAVELSNLIHEAACLGEVSSVEGRELVVDDQLAREARPLPSDLLWREPLFDQLIVNVYEPGQGICAHIDLMRFEDGIAIISLESPCVMHFTWSKEEVGGSETLGKEGPSMRIPIFLSPGSLIVMSGEARYFWKHEINRQPGFQFWEGTEIHQQRRTSVTLRKLCKLPS